MLARQENLGAQERVADLVENERVEFVGPDASLGTAPILAADAEGSWLRQ